MPTATLIGSTGLVGSFILSHLLTSPSQWSSVTTISRRAPKTPSSPPSSTLATILDSDVTSWPEKLPSSPASDVVFSSLGTTRAAAGGVANQWKIDHDANVALAKAAKEKGVKTFVFISSAGTRGALSKMVPYSKMKIGTEDTVRELGFENAIILRPGMILGEREQARASEGIMQGLVRGLGSVSEGAKNMLGQEASVIARAAVRAAKLAAEGKAPNKYWVLEQADIIKYGKEEKSVKADEAGKGT